MSHAILVVALTVCFSATLVNASAGDRSPAFRSCVTGCQISGCFGELCETVCPNSQYKPERPLVLWRWSCDADCKYHCMQSIEHLRALHGASPLKYYGKWPFRRVLGMQEIASSTFSILNLLAHVHCMARFARHLRTASVHAPYPYGWLWLTWSTLSANSWVWSFVFHGRDTRITERLDYLSAISVVMFSLAAAIIRTMAVQRLARQMLVLAAVTALYLVHCHHMLFVKFDYGYNMKVCIGVGALGAAMWITFCATQRHPARGVLLAFMACVYGAMAFEVLDFPPIAGLLDAHAVWHALTAPLVYLWYRFVHADARHIAIKRADKD